LFRIPLLLLAVAGALVLAAPAASHAAERGVVTRSTLERGDRGLDVKALQRALRITADGVYGPGTRRAVRRFQKRRGLTVDGVAGPATMRALGLTIRPRAARASEDAMAVLQRIAQCESGGDPKAVSRDGRYRGKYQFLRSTWRALGGTGDPAEATEAEQDRLALALYRREGIKPWPHCGRQARAA
jgi:lysozyme family protein